MQVSLTSPVFAGCLGYTSRLYRDVIALSQSEAIKMAENYYREKGLEVKSTKAREASNILSTVYIEQVLGITEGTTTC